MREVKATHLFWVDQVEYYFVCDDCYLAFRHLQWSGNTKVDNWTAQQRRVYRELEKGKFCEWCLADDYPSSER